MINGVSQMVSYPGLSERGAFMGLIPNLLVLLIVVAYVAKCLLKMDVF